MHLHAAQATFLVGLLAYQAIRTVYQRRARAAGPPKANHSSRQDKALIVLVAIGQMVLPLAYIFTPWLDGASHDAAPDALPYAGALVWAAGLWLFWRAHAELGTWWSITLEIRHDHQLVQRGVYRVVRHPMYAAFLLFGVAQAMLLPNAIAGPAALVAVAILCIVRIPREEAMMCDVFGQAYRDYMRTTGAVIPRLVPRRRIA
ncbi:protein-S-isoprenylcysteine O-methyltransferase [Paracidovorax avenae]|uniref:protein-S-isoprenylcysteine O-methyltransferase n=1 Tax=Paracidovorax avenae TaxID=80867 RepID=UPI000D2227AC|nr:protein-S-isoprenylcysteine O-methyltransferase [Paracidovorax avenae]AVT11536.1 isoprenylcysteine carboxylmethyltransferase family protein [Paracidovorax avenae]